MRELLRLIAAANPDVEPAVRGDIDQREFLRQPQRVREWQHRDGEANPDPLGGLGKGRSHRRQVADDAVVREVVLGQPAPVESETVGENRLLDRLAKDVALRAVTSPREEVIDPELHTLPPLSFSGRARPPVT